MAWNVQNEQTAFVFTGGNDSNNGGPTDPFLTIGHAISVINGYGDASNSKYYNILLGPGNWNETLLLPPYVFIKGEGEAVSVILNPSSGSLALDTTAWNAASQPQGGFGTLSLGAGGTYDLSGTTLGELYVSGIAIIGAPSTFNGSSTSQLYITDSEFYGITCNGGTVKIYDSLLGTSASTFANSASATMTLRMANVKAGANMTLDANTHSGSLSAYLGAVQFYNNSNLTINGSSATVHATIDSFPPSGHLILQNSATDMILYNGAIRSEVAGTGIGVSTTNGISTISNTGVTSAVAGTGIGVSGATGAVTISNTGVLSVASGSANVTIGGTAANPTISVTDTDITTIQNDSSAGNAQLVESSPVTSGTATIKTLTAGSDMALTNGANTVTISHVKYNATLLASSITLSDASPNNTSISPSAWTLDASSSNMTYSGGVISCSGVSGPHNVRVILHAMNTSNYTFTTPEIDVFGVNFTLSAGPTTARLSGNATKSKIGNATTSLGDLHFDSSFFANGAFSIDINNLVVHFSDPTGINFPCNLALQVYVD